MKRTLLLSALALAVTGCPSSSSSSGPAASATAAPERPATAASASAAVVAPSTSAEAVAAPPACTVSSEKSWVSGVNKTTGLTASALTDGDVAIGLAVGNTPHVLVVGANGEGRLVKLPPKPGTALAKPVKDGRRTLLRVTPVKVDEHATEAFVDYKDEYKDKHRRVSCGPADGSDSWIVFDDVPLLDRDPPPTGAERAALFAKKSPDADEGYHELRDCRSFADLASGETWIVGSELRATDQGGSTTWKASLVIDRGPKSHEVHLHELDLKGDPPKITDYQVPMLAKLHGGSWILTARYGDSMLAALLKADKSLDGSVVRYPGFSTRADVADDGDDTVITTSIAKGKDFLLRAIRLSAKKPELPKALSAIVTDDDDKDSEGEPDYTRDSKGRRWVSYVEGERGKGNLEIVPVDASFHAVGKPFQVTKESEHSSEARMIELKNGNILVTFMREKDAGVELVTEELHCEPTPK